MERHEEMLSPEEQYAQLAPTLDADGFSLYAAAEEVTGLKVYEEFPYEDNRGMFEMAERDLPEGIDKVHSYMIGDKRIDAQAGKNFGVTGVLVGTGYGAKEHAEDRAAGLVKEDGSCPAGGYDAYAETLLDAVRGILGGRI